MKISILIIHIVFIAGCSEIDESIFFAHAHTSTQKPKTLQPTPKLINSNFEEAVTYLQSRFILNFDRPVKLTPESQIKITNKNNKKFIYKIDNFLHTNNNKNLEILVNNLFDKTNIIPTENFLLEIENLQTIDEQVIIFKPLDIKLISPDPHLISLRKPIIKISSNSARFNLRFNNIVTLEVSLIGEKGKNILFNQCSYAIGATCEVHINNLTPNTNYEFIITATDYQSNTKIFNGNFKTAENSALKISEIMINPKVLKDEKQNEYEFIKIKNISNKELFIDTIILEIINKKDYKKIDYFTVNINKEIPANSEIFITGKNFHKENDTIFKTDHVSLGMSDKESKIISIFKNEREYFDEYHGFLWPPKKGDSIKRKDLMGIDEEENYCYLAY